MNKRRFLDLLVEHRHLVASQAQALEARHRGNALAALEELLARQALLPKDEDVRLYGDTLGIAYVDLSRTIIQSEVVSLLRRDFAVHRIVPSTASGGR